MSLLKFRRVAPIAALMMSVAIPFTASAATSGGALCASASSDPAAFVAHPEFAARLVAMSDACPELAFALTNSTGSIPEIETSSKDANAKAAVAAPDYSDLLGRLASATKTLNGATKDVAVAQDALERTIRRAKKIGLTDDDLQLVVVIRADDNMDALRRVLPDFTADKRRALENYLDARDTLKEANADLDRATENAKPLVQKAMDLAGLSDKAQGDLSAVLDGQTADERKAALEKAIADASQSAKDLAAKISATNSKLKDAEKKLDDALKDKKYKDAVEDVRDEEEDLEEAKADVAKAEAKLSKANSNKSRKDAAEELEEAKDDLKEATKKLAEAKADLDKVSKSLNLAGLSSSIVTLTAELGDAKAAEVAAKEKAKAAGAKADELAKLLNDAADALKKASEASDEAKAATATEEANVIAAQTALQEAIDVAKAALAGSAEEEAALQAVLDAQADLTAALTALGTAQDVSEALAEEIADIQGAPEAVVEAGEALDTASADGEAVVEGATDTAANSDEVVADYNDANADLQGALSEEKTSAPAEAASDESAAAQDGAEAGTADAS